MDEVTRPKSAAQRHSGPRSVSTSTICADDTSEDTIPSDAKGSDDEESDEDESSSDTSPGRNPDPRATRHSSRAEANKKVNYSRKHHPQDFGLPGHQHKAIKLRRAEKKRKRNRGGISSPRSRSGTAYRDGLVVEDFDNDEEEILGQGGELEPRERSKPQKRLRILSDGRRSSQPPPKQGRNRKAKKVVAPGESDCNLPIMTAAELNEFVNGIIDSSVRQRPIEDDDGVQDLGGTTDDAGFSGAQGALDGKLDRPFAGYDTFVSDDEEVSHENRAKMQSQHKRRTSVSRLAVEDGEEAERSHMEEERRVEPQIADMTFSSLIHTQYLDGAFDEHSTDSALSGKTPASKPFAAGSQLQTSSTGRPITMLHTRQVVTPLTGFRDGSLSQPVPLGSESPRRAVRLVDHAKRSRVAGESSRASMPMATPRSLGSRNALTQTGRWVGTLADVLGDEHDDEDENEDEDEDQDDAEGLQHSDAGTSTRASSPSRLVEAVD